MSGVGVGVDVTALTARTGWIELCGGTDAAPGYQYCSNLLLRLREGSGVLC